VSADLRERAELVERPLAAMYLRSRVAESLNAAVAGVCSPTPVYVIIFAVEKEFEVIINSPCFSVQFTGA